MGTVASFLLLGEDEVELHRATDKACRVLHRADELFSTWRPDSPLSRLRRGEIELPHTPSEIRVVLDLCAELAEMSCGWFDPWRMPGGVDPTGLVKGWAVEQASQVLRTEGVSAGLLNAGGDITTFGRPADNEAWRVAVRHPASPQQFTCVAALGGDFPALATSGNYERGEHVLNPFDGRPADGIWSATVVGNDLAVADAMATAVFAAGEEGLDLVANLPGHEAWIVLHDGAVSRTDGFPVLNA